VFPDPPPGGLRGLVPTRRPPLPLFPAGKRRVIQRQEGGPSDGIGLFNLPFSISQEDLAQAAVGGCSLWQDIFLAVPPPIKKYCASAVCICRSQN